MTWTVLLHADFEAELRCYDQAVRLELAAIILLLQQFGPHLKRPRCDPLNGSAYLNMKELRFDAADGVWRVAFAFDPDRRAVLLVGGDKSGTSTKKFYKGLIRVADRRFKDWLET